VNERERAVRICIDMAERYDADIEGCDGDELIAYSEAISCCFRLAYIIKYDKFPKDKGWDKEFIELFKNIRKSIPL